MIILFLIVFLALLFTDDVQSQSYDESMRKNITHLQCYEGIDSKMKARSCPAYSVTCSKVKMCLDNDCKKLEVRRFCGPIQRGTRFTNQLSIATIIMFHSDIPTAVAMRIYAINK